MRTLRRNILQFPGKPKKLFVRYRKRTYTIVHSKDIFKISLIVIVLTILAVYFWGLGAHHTFYQNSIISTTVLSCAFFTFVTIGLYNGIKLKDNLGNVVDQYKPVGISDTFELGGLTPLMASMEGRVSGGYYQHHSMDSGGYTLGNSIVDFQ
jgi:hypothetical protein